MGQKSFRSYITPLSRLIGWLGVLAVAIVSLLPGELRPHTGTSGSLEHFVAYSSVAAILTFAYQEVRAKLVIFCGLCVCAGLFEVLQTWVPGRSGDILDWSISSAGALAGLLAAWSLLRLIKA